jgi:hypothetical protein
VGILVLLAGLAHACPTDPTWIGGIYDDNDYDDVVLFITGGLMAVDAGVVDAIGSAALSLRLIEPSRPHTVPVRPLQSLSSRAPPRLLS